MADSTDPDEAPTVVDADVHVEVSTEAMAAHVDEPVRRRLRHSYAFPTVRGSDWDRTMGGAIDPPSPLESPDDVERVVRDGLGVDRPVLNPTLGLGKVSKPELAVSLMRARNRAFAETYLHDTDLCGLGAITTRRPDAVAEEIDRLGGEDGIVGLVVESLGTGTALGDPSLDPVYAAAADNGLPVAIHASAAENFMYSFPAQDKGVRTFLSAHTLGHAWGPSYALASLLVQGVPEKFPDLEFVVLEAGLAWVPGLVWQLNRGVERRPDEAPLLERSPEAYVRERFSFGTHPLGVPDDPERLRAVVDDVGVDSILFASDYPHWDAEPAGDLGRLLDVLDSEERARVLGGNAARVFGLDD